MAPTTEPLARNSEPLFGTPIATPTTRIEPETNMSSFSTYLIGFIVLIIGLAIAAILVGVSQTWVIVGAIILIGIAIITATTRTKTKDPPAPPA